MRLERQGALFATFSLGKLKVTALSDGYADMQITTLRGRDGAFAPPAFLTEAGLTGEKLRLDVNAFLIEALSGNLLIDCGSGNAWHSTAGRLYEAFDDAEISRNSVSAVAITHTHIDHINGLVTPDGQPAFPSAEAVYVPENELRLFAAESRLAPVAGMARPLKDRQMIGEHVTVEAAYGHEIGHSAFLVQSGPDRLLVWGDIIHAPSVQFAHPEVTWEFDADADEARRTRAGVLERAARGNLPVAGAHLAFPGIGLVTVAADAYRYTPLA